MIDQEDGECKERPPEKLPLGAECHGRRDRRGDWRDVAYGTRQRKEGDVNQTKALLLSRYQM